MSCTSLLCDNDATTLSLSCETSGDSTEKISAITAVGINSTSLACDTLETNPYFSVCNLDAATELIEEYCLDKTKCTINAASIISATCPTTQGLELFAKITCKANPTISTTTILILVLYFCIMFALGASEGVTVASFKDIVKNKKRAFFCGIGSQFGFMPLFAYTLCHIFQLDDYTAIGVILTGSAPGGSTSNLLTYWVNGNTSMSIAMSCFSTLFAIPGYLLLWLIYVKTTFAKDENIELPIRSILVPLAVVIVGVTAGMALKYWSKKHASECGPVWRRMPVHTWAEKIGSLLGLIFLIAAFIVAVRDYPEILNASDFPKEWAMAAFFQPVGAAFGYTLAWLAGLDSADRRAICLETGVQSYPIVLAITGLSFTGCLFTKANTFPLIATLWYLISTAWMVPLIQITHIKDSCLQRIIKNPSILEPHIPECQSVVVSVGESTTSTKAEGAPRRLTAGPVPTASKFGPEIDNCYSMFARAAAMFPTNPCFGYRPALPDGKLGGFEWITYAEALERMHNLASGIAQLGLAPKATFGMYAANSIGFQVTTIGMFSQGYTCVPVYDTLGEDILQYEVNHADITILFVEDTKLSKVAKVLKDCPTLKYVVQLSPITKVEESVTKVFEAANVSLLDVDSLMDKGKEKPVEAKPAKGDDLAFVMYTSGTTGDPKGVCIKQISITIGASYCGGIDLLPTDRYLSFLPLAHIFETMVEHGLLARGGSIGFFNGNIRKLQDDIITLKPTIFIGVPRVYQRFYEAAEKKVAELPGPLRALLSHALKKEMAAVQRGKKSSWGKILTGMLGAKIHGGSVRMMLSGAAPLPLHVHEFLVAAMGCPVVQGYGMTENCANATLELIGDSRAGHVGPPMPTCEIKLVDVPEMNYTSAENQSGEVCTRGPTVFAGYHKNKEETDKVLEPDGWLHTGDIGRWNADGTLSIIDRKKNIFKLSQGEYVAAEKVEMIVSKSKYVAQPWIYGNSFFPMLVSVVTPDWAELKKAAQEGGWYNADQAVLAASSEAKKFILNAMTEEAKAAKLKPFELPKAVHLEAEVNELNQGFSIVNDCLTPTFKLKRPQLLQRYQKQVDEMYVSLGEDPSKHRK